MTPRKPWTDDEIAGVRKANLSLEFALSNCRRAVDGKASQTPGDFMDFSKLFGAAFGGDR